MQIGQLNLTCEVALQDMVKPLEVIVISEGNNINSLHPDNYQRAKSIVCAEKLYDPKIKRALFIAVAFIAIFSIGVGGYLSVNKTSSKEMDSEASLVGRLAYVELVPLILITTLAITYLCWDNVAKCVLLHVKKREIPQAIRL